MYNFYVHFTNVLFQMNYIVYLYCDSEVLELKNCDIMSEKLKNG